MPQIQKSPVPRVGNARRRPGVVQRSATSPSSSSDAYDIASDLATFDEAARQITAKFSTAETVYIALGESGTPILLFLKKVYGGKVLWLPLSSIKAMGMGTGATVTNSDWPKKTWQDENSKPNLVSFLDTFVGPAKLGGKKKVLLVDFVQDGWGLSTVHYFLKKYYEEKDPSITVTMFALNIKSNLPSTAGLPSPLSEAEGLEATTALGSLATKIHSQVFKDSAGIRKYEKFPIGSALSGFATLQPPQKSTTGAYGKLKESIKNYKRV